MKVVKIIQKKHPKTIFSYGDRAEKRSIPDVWGGSKRFFHQNIKFDKHVNIE
jgi:hypothetical protein